MEIEFKNGKLKKLAESFRDLSIKYGKQQAEEIIQRITELQAARNLKDIQLLPKARLHALSSNWRGCFAVDIKHPYRVIFEPIGEFDRGDISTIKSVRIREIYHDYH